MVYEVAVNTAVAILERMDEDEAECETGGGDDGIEMPPRRPIESNHPVYKCAKILRAGADVVRQRHSALAVVLADKAALSAKPEAHEPHIADDDPLQPQQFVQVERLPSCLADGTAP